MNGPFEPSNLVKLWLLACCVLVGNLAWSQVEFRAIGGPGIDRGEVVLPHAGGAYLLGTTQPQDGDVLRPYVVHYDNNLAVDWSLVLPSSDALEWVVDARLNTLNEARILTQRLRSDGSYGAAIHTVNFDGETTSIRLLDDVATNFIPAKLCEWQGQVWAVGHSGNRLVAADVSMNTVLEWGGTPGQEHFIADVLVHNNMLIAVGSQLEDGISSAAVWGVYPLGQLAFDIVTPNEEGWTESRMDGIDVRNNSIRILRTFQFIDDSGNDVVSHDFLALNINTGEVGEFWAGDAGEEGRDLIWTQQGVAKLLKSSNVESLDDSFLIAHISPSSSYVSQGHFGTSFEEDPSRLSLGPDGAVWAAGSTRGVLDGSWSACLLRLDSLGPLGTWANGNPGFGVVNDPTLLSWNAIDEPVAAQHAWGCHPNPALDEVHLIVPDAFKHQAQAIAWVIRDAGGRVAKSGEGIVMDVSSLRFGSYTLEGQAQGQHFSLPFMKVTR